MGDSDKLIFEAIALFLAAVVLVAWLGGGRKWVFRVLLSYVILVVVGVAGTLCYVLWDEHASKVHEKKLHECAVAKVAAPECFPAPQNSDFPKGSFLCPAYQLPTNPTPQQEQDALDAALKECQDQENGTLHDEISHYRVAHGIKQSDADASRNDETAKCAAKVRKNFPNAYNDLDDDTLVKKVLAKYPDYCSK
jgi:hypothetical protein